MGANKQQKSRPKFPLKFVVRLYIYCISDQVIYGLNISNSKVTNNLGKGVYLYRIRDRTVINNVTITRNKHLAGIHIDGGIHRFFTGGVCVWQIAGRHYLAHCPNIVAFLTEDPIMIFSKTLNLS